eukprot:gnl/Chilomastix_cuspidata/1915.p1 GENE.gnl/Chilomastix_cuspidata/1915~~gnl/Chilomastix_cuspidata/1915.p1  ORF type:complete len:471 (+),score=176.35 gnl/Chilomastix_cuspidata/1915:144-1415(+)
MQQDPNYIYRLSHKDFALDPLPPLATLKKQQYEAFPYMDKDQDGTIDHHVYFTELKAVKGHYREIVDTLPPFDTDLPDALPALTDMSDEDLIRGGPVNLLACMAHLSAKHIAPLLSQYVHAQYSNKMQDRERVLERFQKRVEASLAEGKEPPPERPRKPIVKPTTKLLPLDPARDAEAAFGKRVRDLVNARDFVYVDTEPLFEDLLAQLNRSRVFAFDLEHTCFSPVQATALMQITTEDGTDFIVDTLELWPHIHRLRAPFANPNILVVGHQIHCDVDWLWRDFRIPVVNVFETGAAAEVISRALAGTSAYIGLQKVLWLYFNIHLTKGESRSRWGARPLTAKQLKYAQADTSYLIPLMHAQMQVIRTMPAARQAQVLKQLDEAFVARTIGKVRPGMRRPPRDKTKRRPAKGTQRPDPPKGEK